MFGALIRQPVAFFDSEEVGSLTSRLGSDCQAVVRCLSTNINVALRNSLQSIGACLLNPTPYTSTLLIPPPAVLNCDDQVIYLLQLPPLLPLSTCPLWLPCGPFPTGACTGSCSHTAVLSAAAPYGNPKP